MNKVIESGSYGNILNVKLVNDKLLSSIFKADKFIILIDSQSLLDQAKLVDLDHYFTSLVTLIKNYHKEIKHNNSIPICILVTKFDLLKQITKDTKDTLKSYLPNFISALNPIPAENIFYMKSYIKHPFDYSQTDYHSFLTWLPEN